MRYILYISIIIIAIQCRRIDKSKTHVEAPQELLVYCENSMVQPLLELKTEFEDEWGCEIVIHNDCSQNLISLIQYSLKGDLFMPGSQEGFNKLRARHGTIVTDSVFVGYNPLVLMVENNNPTNYSGQLSSIIANNKAIIIANPETCSLGYETKKLLEQNNVYNETLDNVISLSADSRGLIKSIFNREAQVTINWRSVIYNNTNSNELDVIAIPDSDQNPPEVYVGMLSTVESIELAHSFLEYVASSKGEQIFKKYGFIKHKNRIF